MAILDRLLGRSSKRAEPKSPSALTSDALRDTIVAEAEQDVPRFADLVNQVPTVETDIGEQGWHTFGEAVRDVARGAYSYDEPRTRGRDEMLPSHLFNREVVSQVMASPEFEASRMYTSGNAPEALFSAIALGDVLQQNAQECSEHIKRSEDANQQEEDLRTIEQRLEELRATAKAAAEGGADPHQLPEQLVSDIKQQTQVREVAKSNLAKLAQEHAQSNASAVAYEIAQQAGKRANEQAQVMAAAFGIAPGSEAQVAPEQRIALAEQWAENPRLRKVLELTGRLIRDVRFKRQAKTKNVNIEPVGITTGRDFPRMLPHELARAFMPALRVTWIKDYSERSLLEYQMSGKEPVGKGAVIFVKDGSGSMAKDDKLEWATAVQLACLSIAQREKRDFAGIEFGGTSQAKAWLFPKRQPASPEEVLDMASHFYRSSGTSIFDGLARAKQILDAGEPFTTADIVLCTDGICPFTGKDQALVNELRANGVRIHGLSILAPNNKYLSLACDWQVDVAELAGSNEATDRLATEIT